MKIARKTLVFATMMLILMSMFAETAYSSSNVDKWCKNRQYDDFQKQASESHFDNNDALGISDLKAVMGQESSYGTQLKENLKYKDGACGYMMFTKQTAERFGLTVDKAKDIDERFDAGKSIDAGAKYLKTLDDIFKDGKTLTKDLKAIEVKNKEERKKFDFAAYNGGEGRIAKAQEIAKSKGDDPAKWSDVQKYLENAGASADKAKEIRDYVIKVSNYSREFTETCIPEFATIAIPVVTTLLLVFSISRRKQKG